MSPLPLPLTVPLRDILVETLRSVDEAEGLDRDGAYLLARLERGESVKSLVEEDEAKWGRGV